MVNKFVLSHEVKSLNVDGKNIRYLRLGKKTVFLDIPIQDNTIGHFLENVELKEISEYHYKIVEGNKNIFIVEYIFKTGNWCGLRNCTTPYSKIFNYWIKNKDWDFITDKAGIVVETDKNYVIVEKYYKEPGVWNDTEKEYILADKNGMQIIEFDITKIMK